MGLELRLWAKTILYYYSQKTVFMEKLYVKLTEVCKLDCTQEESVDS